MASALQNNNENNTHWREKMENTKNRYLHTRHSHYDFIYYLCSLPCAGVSHWEWLCVCHRIEEVVSSPCVFFIFTFWLRYPAFPLPNTHFQFQSYPSRTGRVLPVRWGGGSQSARKWHRKAENDVCEFHFASQRDIHSTWAGKREVGCEAKML